MSKFATLRKAWLAGLVAAATSSLAAISAAPALAQSNCGSQGKDPRANDGFIGALNGLASGQYSNYNDCLNTRYQVEKAQGDYLSKRLNDAKAQQKRSEKELASLKKQIADLRTSNETLRQRIASVKVEADADRQKLAEIQAQIARNEEALQALQDHPPSSEQIIKQRIEKIRQDQKELDILVDAFL